MYVPCEIIQEPTTIVDYQPIPHALPSVYVYHCLNDYPEFGYTYIPKIFNTIEKMLLPFKKVLSTSVVFALFASLVLFSSCGGDDDDVTPDTTAPEVTIEGLTNDAAVNGTVAVSLDSDENDLDKVEIYVDGTLVTTLTGSPFQYTWDSNTVQDGTHTIKVVAYDKSGNKTEQQVSVAVSNMLVSFSIAANQLETEEDYKERGFVFLSDENGKVIASTEYENGKSYTLKNAEFKGEKFFLSEVVVRTGTESDRSRIITFPQVERGKSWKLSFEHDEDETFVGEATLNFTNLANGYAYYVESNGDQAFPDEYHLSEVVKLRKNPSLLYVEKQDQWATQTPTYRLFTNITTGASYTINLNTITTPVTETTVELPDDAYYAQVEVRAFAEAGVYENAFRLGSFGSSGSQLKYHYPGTAFPSYYSQIELEADEFFYSRGNTEKMFEVKYLENDVTFDYSNGKLTYSAVGDFDFVAAILGYDEEQMWAFVLPEGTNQIVPKLELPQSLSGFQFAEFALPIHYTVDEFASINSYNELKDFIRSSEYSIDELFEDGMNYIEMSYENSSEGGRVGKKQKPASLRRR